MLANRGTTFQFPARGKISRPAAGAEAAHPSCVQGPSYSVDFAHGQVQTHERMKCEVVLSKGEAQMIEAVLGLAGAVHIAIIVALLCKYRRTGDRGLLWLGIPLVIGPLLVIPLDHWLAAFFPLRLSSEER